MATLRRYAGDAPAIAQEILLPSPPAGYTGKVTIGINRKSIEFDSWDVAVIVAAWNASEVPDFQRCIASEHNDGVLMTASTAGEPFEITLNYGGGNAFDEVVIISFLNVGVVTGTYDITLLGETITVTYGTSAADVETALEATASIAPGDVAVADLGDNQLQFTIAGQYAGQNVTDLVIDDAALRGGTADLLVTRVRDYRAGQNEIQRIVLGGGPTGGTILYDLDGAAIGPVNYNDAVADYQTAFDAALGAGEATVTAQSGTGEVGPLQTEAFVATHDKDTGYSYDPATSQVVKVDKAAITIGNEQIVSGGDAIWVFPRTAFLLVKTDTAIPANLQIERAVLQLAVLSSSFNARVDVVIRAVNQASPSRIIEGDWADFSTRPLTTASVNWTAVVSPNNTTILPPSLHTIVQELIDTHGTVSDIMFYLETQSSSIGSVTFYEPGESGYITTPDPTLLVDYRDGASGPSVFDVEFKGSRAETSLPLMTANIDSLLPRRQNTIWEIDIYQETGAPIDAPGVITLYDGATLLQSAGTDTSAIIFAAGIVTVLDAQFGTDNYVVRNDVDDIYGRVEIELIADYSGAVNLSDNLVLYWAPVANTDSTGSPLARMELINEGGAGLAEQQTITIDASAVRGTYSLIFGAETTAALQYNATALQVQTALEELTAIGAGKVICTDISSGVIRCEFDLTLGNPAQMGILNNLKSVDAPVIVHGLQNIDTYHYLQSTLTAQLTGKPTPKLL